MQQRKWSTYSNGKYHPWHSKTTLFLSFSIFLLLIAVFRSMSLSPPISSPTTAQHQASSSTVKLEKVVLPIEELETPSPEDELDSNNEYPVSGLTEDNFALKQVQTEVSAHDVASFPQNKKKTTDSDSDNDDSDDNTQLRDEDIFQDYEEYKNAPIITSPEESATLQYREIVLQHERYYRTQPTSRLYVPRLRKDTKLTVSQFAKRFIQRSQPVIVPFEAMRHLGFTSRSFTLDELLQVYPNYKRTLVYKYGRPGPGELDLGPAVYALQQGEALRKSPAGRNFPRNTKITLDQVSKLTVQNPPFVLPNTPMLPPSLWFATKTSSTVFHSDCCDNFAMMFLGSKRWTLSPPHEARLLQPNCSGGLCWVKKLEHPDEHASPGKEQELADRIQKVTFMLNPGEMLYLPTGFFHHVEQDEPTIMVNFWTKGGAGFLKFLDGSILQTISDLEKQEAAVVA